MFAEIFNIPMKGEAKGKAHYVGWLQKFNEIRRIPAHPSGARSYEEADYEFMKHIKFEFYKRYKKVLGITDLDHDTH